MLQFLLADEIPTPEMVTGGYEWAFFKMIFALVVLLLAIFLTVWALKRLTQGRFLQMNSTKEIKVLERRPLSQKSMLYLVEVGGKKILLAESHLEIRRLASLSEKDE